MAKLDCLGLEDFWQKFADSVKFVEGLSISAAIINGGCFDFGTYDVWQVGDCVMRTAHEEPA